MKRRDLVKGAGIALVGTAVASPAISQGLVRWRMPTSWPKSLDTIYGSAAAFGQRVSQLTGGRFQIEPFPAGEIVGGLQALDATMSGSVECCHSYSSYYMGKNPVYAFDGGMPFGLNARQQQAWMQFGGGLQLMRDIFRPSGIIPFPAGNTGVQMGGWFRREIKEPDDLKGLKFRIGGFGGQVISKLGAVPQQIASSEIYSALERGTLDAVEFIGPYDDEKLGFYKVAKYYYTPGWWEGSAQVNVYVNINAWEKLPSEFRNALEVAANEQTMLMVAKYDAVNPAALKSLVAKGAELRVFPRPVLEACYKASIEVFDEIAEKNADFKRVYEIWKPYVADINQWFRVTEYVLDGFRLSKSST